MYLSDREFEDVAEALVSTHPCLKEPGSVTGFGRWKTSLKYKFGNYWTKLRHLGCPEVAVNSLTHKPDGKCSPAYGVKKPRKAEVNYCPPLTIGWISRDAREDESGPPLTSTKKKQCAHGGDDDGEDRCIQKTRGSQRGTHDSCFKNKVANNQSAVKVLFPAGSLLWNPDPGVCQEKVEFKGERLSRYP